ncbi:MAG: glycosyltransferase family 2 protein [Gemmatimonadales bacterium]|nr:glycosyltransferase family 2 protein [Gemmatimonadales bacterium]
MTRMAVAVVNLNTREHLRVCLRTALAAAAREIVVADNGSSDGSLEMVRAEYPGVRLQVHSENPGYGAASNRAIAACTSPYVLLLNSDTEIRPGALEALTAYLDEQPESGIAGPRLLNPDGTLQPSCYPFPGSLAWLLDNNTLSRSVGVVPGLRDLCYRTSPHDRARPVPFVKGAALAIRRTAFDEVRGFDESFFMYAEEVDLCYRLGAAGWEIHFAPVTDVTHVGGASTRQVRTAMAIEHYRADLRFYRRHYAPARVASLVALHKLNLVARLVRDSVSLRSARADRPNVAEDLAAWKRLLLEG